MKDSSKKIHLKDCSLTKNGRRYNYYALAEASKVDGRNQKKVIKYLGELTEAQVESYRYALRSINDGRGTVVDIDDLVFEDRKNFLDVAVLHHLWQRLKLSEAFLPPSAHPRKDVATSQVAEILTLSKLLKPSSNTGTIDWWKSTYLPDLMGVEPDKYNRMKIFNELSEIDGRKTQIEKKLFEIARSQSSGEFELIFIDGTTTYFEGTHCELGKPGKDKTTGFKTHQILILLLTNREGLPCAWDVCDGSEKEVSRFADLAERICDEHKITNVTYCFDRGFASNKNFKAIKGFLSKFISGLDKDQIADVFDIEKFQATREKILEHAKALAEITEPIKREAKRRIPQFDGFYSADGERYYKDLGVKGLYRRVVGFSTEIFQAAHENREQNQLEALLKISALNAQYNTAKKDRDLDVAAKRVDEIIENYQMKNLITYTLTPMQVKAGKSSVQSCSIHPALDAAEWHKAGLLDGIFVYITDHIEKTPTDSFKVSAYDITRHYKDKYVIEQNFRDLKNVVNIRPLFVRLPEHVRALIGISVVAQFINMFITRKLAVIGMPLSEFYSLLERSAAVAVLKTPKRTLSKLIKTQPKLIQALDVLQLKDSVFSKQTMAILN
jgi:transposase